MTSTETCATPSPISARTSITKRCCARSLPELQAARVGCAGAVCDIEGSVELVVGRADVGVEVDLAPRSIRHGALEIAVVDRSGDFARADAERSADLER